MLVACMSQVTRANIEGSLGRRCCFCPRTGTFVGKSSASAPAEKRSVAFVGTTTVAGATIIPYFSSVETMPSFAIAMLRLAAFVIGIYWCIRGLRTNKRRSRALIRGIFLVGGIVLVFVSIFGTRVVMLIDKYGGDGGSSSPSASGPSPSSSKKAAVRTFRNLWHPALDRQSITDGDVARAVDGMELEARNCGSSGIKSFELAPLQEGDQLAFDLQIFDQSDVQGAYRVHLYGAGVDDSFNLTDEKVGHVSVETDGTGDVTIDISALRPANGTCRDSREFLAVQNGTID